MASAALAYERRISTQLQLRLGLEGIRVQDVLDAQGAYTESLEPVGRLARPVRPGSHRPVPGSGIAAGRRTRLLDAVVRRGLPTDAESATARLCAAGLRPVAARHAAVAQDQADAARAAGPNDDLTGPTGRRGIWARRSPRRPRRPARRRRGSEPSEARLFRKSRAVFRKLPFSDRISPLARRATWSMKLKRIPEDFQVEELTDVAPSDGPFALYRLTKRWLGTPEAVEAILQCWRIERRTRLVRRLEGLPRRHATAPDHRTRPAARPAPGTL